MTRTHILYSLGYMQNYAGVNPKILESINKRISREIGLKIFNFGIEIQFRNPTILVLFSRNSILYILYPLKNKAYKNILKESQEKYY